MGLRLGGSIAAYERTLLMPGSRFDRWLKGDVNAITAEEFAAEEFAARDRSRPKIAERRGHAALCAHHVEGGQGDGL